MKNKAGIFNRSSISLILAETLVAIVVIFLDTFFVSYLLKIAPGNYSNIAIFNIVYYLVIALAFLFGGFLLKRWKKAVFMIVGGVFLSALMIIVYVLGAKISGLVVSMAILSGLGVGVFYTGFHQLTVELISSKHQQAYSSVKNIVRNIVKTGAPLIIGSLVEFGSFSLMSVVVLIIAMLITLFSLLIKQSKKTQNSYNLVEFVKVIRKDKQYKPLRNMYLSAFLRGMCYDTLATVFTILIFLNSHSDFTLGYWQTIFTATQLVASFIFMKFYHKKNSQYFIFIPLAVIIAGSIATIANPTIITIIVFYGIFSCAKTFTTIVAEARRPSVLRLLSLHKYSLEHNTIFEGFSALGRIIGYSLFFLYLVLPAQTTMLVIMGYCVITFTAYSISTFILERQLIAQDKKWKVEHPVMVAEEGQMTTMPPVYYISGDRSKETLKKILEVKSEIMGNKKTYKEIRKEKTAVTKC